MREEIKYDMEVLKSMVEKGQMDTGKMFNFVEEYNYEEEYSGGEIFDIQADFLHHAKKFLQSNYKGKYAIVHGISCVQIINVEVREDIKSMPHWIIC